MRAHSKCTFVLWVSGVCLHILVLGTIQAKIKFVQSLPFSIVSLFSTFHICTHVATPNPPVITNVTSLSTSISLNWTHDKTCFESVPLEYHIVVNTDTQRIITGEMGTVISVISDTPYTVSVMAVVDDSQRSEPDRESVTAGGCRKD